MNRTRKSFGLILGLALAALSFAPQAQAGTAPSFLSKVFWHTPVKLGAAAGTGIIFCITFKDFINGCKVIASGLGKGMTAEKVEEWGGENTSIFNRLTSQNGIATVLMASAGVASLICLKSWIHTITASDDVKEDDNDYEYSHY